MSKRRVMLIIESSRAYGRECLLGIAAYARHHGDWHMMHIERGLDDQLPRSLKAWGGEGVITRIESPGITHAIEALGLPTVDLRGTQRPRGGAMFDTDPAGCARLAVDHFLQRGFSQLAFCGYEGVDFSDARRDGFLRCVKSKVQVCPPETSGGGGRGGGTLAREAHGEFHEAHLVNWLKTLVKPVGVFACNDMRGRQVLAAAASAGLKVPDEVAVVGVDNDEVICELSNPPLSSVEPDAYRIGYDGAAMLDRMMRGGRAPKRTVMLPPKRVAGRLSSDVVAIDDAAIAQAMRIIRDRACDGVKVEDLLGELSISRATLERRFRQLLGRSPKAEIDRVRCGRAERLLAETTYPLQQIAQMAGYRTAAHFVTAFKRMTGRTPGHYRTAR